jgi:hypothetical protein
MDFTHDAMPLYTHDQEKELTEFRRRLWDKYCKSRFIRESDVPFETYWYEFIIRHLIWEDTPLEETFEKTCNKMAIREESKEI